MTDEELGLWIRILAFIVVMATMASWTGWIMFGQMVKP